MNFDAAKSAWNGETDESSKDASEPNMSEPKILSVSEINKAVRSTLEGKFHLLWIQGEISNFKAHSSGHFYFSLKDSKAQINAVMFRGFNQGLKFKPHDGLEVIVRGKITVYEPRGNYQMFCELMEPVGAGALQMAFEQLKKKLQAEGLFDRTRKRPIPTLPQHVAVVTSPTGAAIRDILNVLGRRFKGLRVTVIPALVQGVGAPDSIVKGIEMAQKLPDVDVMIVGRGGGSIEDMWGFNEEKVARAIAASRIPTISAVGHEIDFTIADFVADLRAPTPSAAAELVCRNAAELIERIQTDTAALVRCFNHAVALKKQRVDHANRRLVDPKRRLQDLSQRCDELVQRLELACRRYHEKLKSRIDVLFNRLPAPDEKILFLQHKVGVTSTRLEGHMARQLEMKHALLARLASVMDSLSPLKVVERGYSIVKRGDEIIKSVESLNVGDALRVRFAKGEADVTVKQIWNGKE